MGVVQPVVVERRQSVISLTVMATGGSNQQSYLLHDSRLNLNEGQGKALDLAIKSQYVSADSVGAALAHSEGVAREGGTLAAATHGSFQTNATTGGSSMSIDEEERSEEKGNEVDRQGVTSSGGMAMSSTEEEVYPHLIPPPPHPPPPTQ